VTGHEGLPHAILVSHEGLQGNEGGEGPQAEAKVHQTQRHRSPLRPMRHYIHQELGVEVALPSGHYSLLKELRLAHNDREVLCVTGIGVVECSCCAGECITSGRGGMYALVPGYLLTWKSGTSDSGLPVSEVEPISDEATRKHIARSIRATEDISNIEFW
jgi:hypothetical protein